MKNQELVYQSPNNIYNTKKKKKYLVKKIILDDENYLKKEIEDQFSDPKKYLELKNDEIIIGKSFKFPFIKKERGFIHYEILGTSSITPKENQTISRRSSKGFNLTKDDKEKQIIYKNDNVDYINDTGLNEIYNKFYQKKIKNLNKQNIFLERIYPQGKIEMKKMLNLQEKYLKEKENYNNATEKLSNRIAVKTGKSKEDVLMNKTDGFRLQKELKDIISVKVEHKNSVNEWMMSLRRKENSKEIRDVCVNLGSTNHPKWTNIKENFKENNFETIRRPNSMAYKEFKDFTKTFNFNKKINLFEIDNIEKVANMEVFKYKCS